MELIPDDRPPTRKQEQLIAKLVKDFPDSKTLYEYEVCLAKHTKVNASAFITLALEANWDAIHESEQYMKYIATRPRAERIGAHGLFGDKDAVSLEKAMEELESYSGNVWTHIMTILPPEKIGRYLQEAEKYGVLPMFYLELSSGLRRGELLALQWTDLNVKERILTVNKQVTRMEGELDVTEPKTKNSVRKVALSQQAVDLLVQEHEQHPDNPILFPSPRTGGYWSPDAVSRINRKLLKNAGIEEHVRFHDLRHTFATMAISSGVDVKTLSSMLGHYSAGFTLDTYTHITNDMQRGAAEKIGGFMESATATTTPEPPDPPEESQCKVIPFERVG